MSSFHTNTNVGVVLDHMNKLRQIARNLLLQNISTLSSLYVIFSSRNLASLLYIRQKIL